MIVLDTNVVSEQFKPRPDPRVGAFLDRQGITTFAITTITLAELLLGVRLLPEGRRRRNLSEQIDQEVEGLFAGRVLPFDVTAARRHAELMAQTRSLGQTLSVPDAQIAAIALDRGYKIATRDTGPFLAAGVEVIDPWEI